MTGRSGLDKASRTLLRLLAERDVEFKYAQTLLHQITTRQLDPEKCGQWDEWLRAQPQWRGPATKPDRKSRGKVVYERPVPKPPPASPPRRSGVVTPYGSGMVRSPGRREEQASRGGVCPACGGFYRDDGRCNCT